MMERARPASRWVRTFGGKDTQGGAGESRLLGGKGANLAEMCRLGLSVPPGFTVTTEACGYGVEHGGALPPGLSGELRAGVEHIECVMAAKLGDAIRPLLVSVRSGAAVSMPGMMDTVLDLGMGEEVALGLARATGQPRFAWDCFRRFVDMFGEVVAGVPHERFEEALLALKQQRGVRSDLELDADALEELTNRYLAVYRRETGHMLPTDPYEQLERAARAVFASWNSARAVKYREIRGIKGLLGTAVNVQAMVFGNLDGASGSGVCFSRNPSTGEPGLYGEYLPCAQGEDVVAGLRTPLPIAALGERAPELHAELVRTAGCLEAHFSDMQDIEFTVQSGKLWILQTRSGKRTGAAAVAVAVDLVREGRVSRAQAMQQLVEPGHVEQLLHPRFGDEEPYRRAGRVLGKGLPASPGAAVGRAVFSAEEAERRAAAGEAVVLVRVETSPEDVAGLHAARGVVTSRGGMTSHAAVVARGWGKPCVAGCADIVIDTRARRFSNGRVSVSEGDWISVNGTTGEVIAGAEPLVEAVIGGAFQTLLEWADESARLVVRANADTPEDAEVARRLGARGIGLCRTEHMFFQPERLLAVREMILADDEAGRRRALERLLPMQRGDFRGILLAMDGLPVTVRLLDPPLHEFLPHEAAQREELARDLGVPAERIGARVRALSEQNPMLGHRGCRLGITHPEITEMQVAALFDAAVGLRQEGRDPRPEIMVPLVGTPAELAHQRAIIDRIARLVMDRAGVEIPFVVGTMIEVPRAALQAGAIAAHAAFFSFGTNDLTQLTFGYSRDDVASFLPRYLELGVLADDPFQTLDEAGVGELVALACARGRAARADLHLGLCGEHGGDPRSVALCHRLGLDYVSCSPYRVPVARLAAAQAALSHGKDA